MSQRANEHHTTVPAPAGLARRAFVTALAGAGVAAMVAPAASLASGEPDPIFAAFEAYKKTQAVFNAASDVHGLAERELEAAGDLFPTTVSIGNPHSGLPGATLSRTHKDIDDYTPVDLYPLENEREHAELSSAIARRDARLIPAEEALEAAWDAEREALGQLVQTVPTTMPGVMAMLELHRDWANGDDAIDADYLSCLVESVHQALEEMTATGMV